ncbi:MAG: hypothetical protein NC092_07530 [Butyrivibrio sp.]|nr:hypothetical protein [Muribaculum sp.]MCM1552524.1 hypothetical protein [Butyrivibrio sp.]
MSEKKHRLLAGAAAFLLLCSLLVNVKNIFTSCQIDAEYQVTMAYRLIRGDEMFSEMWEAHQTSAFFLAFFEWIFLKITNSTTGIMVYANAVGVLCKTTVAFAVYGTLRKYIDKRIAFGALFLALNTYPKDSVLPDFANLQIWFALLLMCCLITYLLGEGKPIWLFAGAVCLCVEVLAYPSCALVWIPCVVLICMYSGHKMRDICIFTGVCAVGGGAYLLYFMHGNPGRFWEYIYYIWSGDESHAVGLGERLAFMGQDLSVLANDMIYIFVLAIGAVIAAAVCRMIRVGGHKSVSGFWHSAFSWFVALYIVCYLISLRVEEAGNKHHFFVLYLVVECVALLTMRYLDPTEKKIFVIGQAIGAGGFAATLILSDLGLFPTLPYLIPNLCVSLLPLGKAFGTVQEGREGLWRQALWRFCPIMMLCAVMFFRNLVYLNGWMTAPSSFREDSIFGVDWTARYGPLKGIVNREGTYVADVSYAEWQELIQPGDRVLVISYPTLTPTVYLYQDVEICADSTISTPTYSERLFKYWEENPDKYPNVVVAKCYGGSLMVGEYNRVVEWLIEEFEADEVIDGEYWRYYIHR